MNHVLVVNPKADEAKAMAEALTSRGSQSLTAASIEQALHTLAREEVDTLVSVRTLPDGSGELLAQQAREVSPKTKVLLVTNFSEVNGAADILRFDFTDYIVDVDDIAGMLAGAKSGPAPSLRSLVDCFLQTVEAVVGLVELTNPLTAGNAASSMRLAGGVAREMGLSEEQRQEVALAALLHDIGNFDVKSGVLEKVDPLSADEEEAIRQHTSRGLQLLDHIDFPWRIKPIILHHHERYDGTGYPEGKKARAIPIGARILAVVDTYLSMTTGRPHKQPLEHEEAVAEIRKQMGTQFDPEVVEAFEHFVNRRKQFAGDLFRVNVMVLEGEEQRLSRLKLQFLREDFKVLSAQDTTAAVEQVEKENIRFLVADVTGQWDRALEILDRLQPRVESFQTSVLLFDGEGSKDRRLTALDNGADEVFPLDVSVAELMSRMRRILKKDEAARRGTLAAGASGISGELSQMSLPEIMQMLNMGQKTAKISLQLGKARSRKARPAEIFLENGRLTHAECGGVEGPDALAVMLKATAGRFQIVHGLRSDKRTVDRDAMAVLLDALRALDEGRDQAPAPA